MTVLRNVRIGQVVCSKSGRDAGKHFVVVGKEQNHVFLADGDFRRVEAPKKKNIKHVQVTGIYLPGIDSTDTGKSLSNREIRQSLKELIPGN